jgi:PIN domain nuclease of toxin-antitoxin system
MKAGRKRNIRAGAKRGAGASRIWRPADLAGYDGELLLDAHVWIWYLNGDRDRLDTATIALLDRTGMTSRLRVLDISYWEVAVKAAKGKIALSMDSAVWLQRAELAPGIRFLPVDRNLLLLSTRLHGVVHNDPADRMLIAAAQIHNVPLVTADRLIVDYAASVPGTPIVDVRV